MSSFSISDTWCPPDKTITLLSVMFSALHLPPCPALSAQSERKGGLQTASHINLQLQTFSSLHFVWQQVCTVQLLVWFFTCLKLMFTLHICVCVCVCVCVRMCVCFRVWLLWVGASSSYYWLCQEAAPSDRHLLESRSLTPHPGKHPEVMQNLKPFTSVCICLWEHISFTISEDFLEIMSC